MYFFYSVKIISSKSSSSHIKKYKYRIHFILLNTDILIDPCMSKKLNYFVSIIIHTEACFAAKTVLWFRKFPLGHLEVFPEKMKMPKTWSKKCSSIAPRMERIRESRTFGHKENRGYQTATDSALSLLHS